MIGVHISKRLWRSEGCDDWCIAIMVSSWLLEPTYALLERKVRHVKGTERHRKAQKRHIANEKGSRGRPDLNGRFLQIFRGEGSRSCWED